MRAVLLPHLPRPLYRALASFLFMSLETASYIHQLNPANPSGADRLKDGDDHIRLIKAALKLTFPGIQGPVDPSVTHTFLGAIAASLVPYGTIAMWSGAATAVPAGWAICDGRTVTKSDGSSTVTTPDLRDRVPIGVNSNAVLAAVGATSKTVTSANAGSHTHSASTDAQGAHSHSGATQSHALALTEIPTHSHYVFAANSAAYGNLGGNPEGAPNSDGVGGSSGASYSIGGSGAQANAGRSSNAGGGQGHTHPISSDGSHQHNVTTAAAGDHAHTVTVDVTQPSLALYFIMKV